MRRLPQLFASNRAWADAMQAADPGFFDRLTAQHAPRYLWIGCADSRVPASQICGLDPGEMFVHRNVANIVAHADLNVLSVLQYAVEVLEVSDIIVCGHYGCGGVRAALSGQRHGLIDNWLRHLKDIADQHRHDLAGMGSDARADRLCELNVAAQVANVCHTTIVQDAWRAGRSLAVHGWIYGLSDGLLKDLDLCVTSPAQLAEVYRVAVR